MITNYGVRYTGVDQGKPTVVVETPRNPADETDARDLLDHFRAQQTHHGKPADAELVIRTKTEWRTPRETPATLVTPETLGVDVRIDIGIDGDQFTARIAYTDGGGTPGTGQGPTIQDAIDDALRHLSSDEADE